MNYYRFKVSFSQAARRTGLFQTKTIVFKVMPLFCRLSFTGYFMDNRRGKGRVGFRPALTMLKDRLVPVIAAETDAGVPAKARLIDADTGFLLLNENPYGPNYTGGIRVALGDLTRDGYPDLVIAQGTPAGGVARNLSWDLGALGNWNTVTTDSVEMTREHNAQNEITNQV
jgi:hypothetical protein